MKVYAINISRNRGISVKRDPKGAAYDMASLQILTPFEGGAGAKEDGSKWERTGYGRQVTELPCRPDCIHEFKDVQFPCEIEVQTENDVVFGRMTTVVSGLNVKASVSRVA